MVALNELMCWEQYYAVGGALRHVEFNPTPGTLNCADFPASVSTAPVQCMEISLYPAYNVLSKMIYPDPELRRDVMCIGGTSQWPATIFRGIDQWGERYGYILVDPIGGAIGAFSHADGISTGGQARTPICKLPNVEHTEQSFPVLFLYRKEITDSGGAGKWRGGLSAESCFIPHGTDSITHDTLSSGNAIPTSTGMMGGYPGRREPLPLPQGLGHPGADEALRAGQRHRPAERHRGRRSSCGSRTSRRTRPTSTRCCGPRPAASATRSSATRRRSQADVDNGDVSEKAALEIYGVVLGDARATERRRAELRARRIHGFAGRGRRSSRHRVRFLATENLAVHDNLRYGCAKCATDLGPDQPQLQGALRAQRPADRGLQPDRRRPEALHRPAAAVPPVLLPGLRPGDRERDRDRGATRC